MTSLQCPPPDRTRRSLSPTGPKFRESCKSCAASKIRCTKKKPQCARCVKRNMVCEYLESKR
ncbi:transcription activator, partial [Aspergillus brunneoviolaceus CBS 621.78]